MRHSDFVDKGVPRLFRWQRRHESSIDYGAWYQPWSGDVDYIDNANQDAACDAEAAKLDSVLTSAQRLTQFEEDSDIESVASGTLHRAEELLRLYFRSAHDELGIPLGMPSISAADQRSVDLYWKSPRRRLLVNIPANPQDPPRFYGQTEAGDKISGTIVSQVVHTLIVSWLSAE